jgi:formylglycine-generating enzyme required for sulfatase activity
MPAATAEVELYANLKQHLAHARRRTDELFRLVGSEKLYERPVPERHRLIFYLGHVEAFDWNMVCRYALSVGSFNPGFDRLFAFGIDPDASGLPVDIPADWPSTEEVSKYNRRVRETVDRLLEEAPAEIIHVAIEHRLMHAETLSYLIHNLPPGMKRAPDTVSPRAGAVPRNEYREILSGSATLGQPGNGSFGWDNEFEEMTTEVPGFSIQRYKVTNGEYLTFVQQGGPVPHFWKRVQDRWKLRTMFNEIPLPMSWPVYVTQAQASAYAQWAGKQLPTEVQYHRAAYGTPEGYERPYPWGSEPPASSHGNFNFVRWDPLPVDANPAGESAFGVAQLLGNGWEWTRDTFRPLPGFRPVDYYPSYSSAFFDEDHYVMKGAAPRTAFKLTRRSFRNWFRRDYKYVYAGFRCVE